MIRNIVFDMGNVLIEYDPKEYIEQFTDKQNVGLLYQTIFQSIQWIQLDRGSIEEEDAKQIFYEKVPIDLHKAVDDIFNNWHEHLPEKNEMFYLAKQLKSKGYNLYLLSNTSKRFYCYCDNITALSYFDGVLISADEHLLKPDLEIYNRLFQRFNLAPEECFFIDDNLMNIEAANFLGMDGFQYKNNIKNLRMELIHRKVLDKELQAVIFDLDGVLVSTDEMHYKAWKQLAEELDVVFNSEIYKQFRGINRMDCLEFLLAESKENYTNKEKDAMLKRKNYLYLKHLEKLSENDICKGVIELLTELESNGVLIAIGSSSKNANIVLEKTKLLPFIDIAVDGNEIVRSKPDPEVFMLAANKLGVPYESCIVIEDAESGLKAAKLAGMKTMGIGDAVRDCIYMDLFFPRIDQVTLEVLKAGGKNYD